MQKVILTQSKVNLQETVKQNKVVYDKQDKTYIVASTKSLNILVNELKSKEVHISKIKTSDVWCSREIVNKHLTALARETFDNEEMQDLFVDYMHKQLEKMCIFEK